MKWTLFSCQVFAKEEETVPYFDGVIKFSHIYVMKTCKTCLATDLEVLWTGLINSKIYMSDFSSYAGIMDFIV